ncbi:glycosyl hydrolase 115 family protein [Pseudoduganella namucuonensis]|uniref:Glycosyl hydrolase family 115 n=1 Tax=Pseudoduganella namucuonensis TaxID=1035707 RepID=A0A1I7FN59_9BURK|nr:glycosyl hydrolase 115 family protein [Pseudoduganella namucuonensis]SFU37601.1 Glycosyl hydrolase family 115 [Pseudoduganella namucuonensis]
MNSISGLARAARKLLCLLTLTSASLCALPAHALGQKRIVVFEPQAGAMALVQGGRAATLYVDASDHAGVVRAAADLREDIDRVTGSRPAQGKGAPAGEDVVIVGTIGKSAMIDRLVKSGALDVSGIKGKWEGFHIQTLTRPMPGVERALVIAGADKRGTIYGIYEISEQIGVSPWYWWADVPPQRHKNLFVNADTRVSDAPVVQYRGIFLNDEAPALTNWVKQTYGGYNHKFYEKVFELILRMRGNYLWPAMWDAAFFDDDKLNGQRAEEYGVVMGTSHHEPMMRAQKEWHRQGKGPWDYTKNASVLKDFWRGGLRNSRNTDKVITLGMRGDGDEPMSEDSNVALLERIVKDQRDMIAKELNPDMAKTPQVWALYKEVQEYYEKGMRVPDDVLLLWCDDNWGNIRRLPTPEERKRSGGAGVYYHFDYVGGPRSYKWLNVTPIPKIWEQMHLAWQHEADRMWIVNVGDLKPMEVPTEFFLTYAWNPAAWPAERLPEYLKLWATREFGAQYADDIADIVAKYTKYNGRRKPEMLEPGTYSLANYNESARIVDEYKALAGRAEKIDGSLPSALRDAFFQLVLYPVQAGAVVNEMYAAAALNRLHAQQGRTSANDLAGRVRALFQQDAELARQYHEDVSNGKWNHMMSQTHLGYTYWNQPPRNVMPPVSEIQVSRAGDMGVTVEGSEQAWPGPGGDKLAMPLMDANSRKPRYVEIFNRGQASFRFKIAASAPWITLSASGGSVGRSQRVMVDVRWDEVPANADHAVVVVLGPDGGKVAIRVPVRAPGAGPKVEAGSYVESGGVVAIEAEHYTKAVAPQGRQWLRIPDHGRTLSGMTATPVTEPVAAVAQHKAAMQAAAQAAAEAARQAAEQAAEQAAREAAEEAAQRLAREVRELQVEAEPAHPDPLASVPPASPVAGQPAPPPAVQADVRIEDQAGAAPVPAAAVVQVPAPAPSLAATLASSAQAMRLEYQVHLYAAGKVAVHATLAPTLKFHPGPGFRYAISIDDEVPRIVDVHADASMAAWEKAVSDGAVVHKTEHLIARPGTHTVKYWAIDPGLVLQKIVVDAGGLRPSYLGPTESPKAP